MYSTFGAHLPKKAPDIVLKTWPYVTYSKHKLSEQCVHATLHKRYLEDSLHSNQGKGLKFLSLCLAFHEVS